MRVTHATVVEGDVCTVRITGDVDMSEAEAVTAWLRAAIDTSGCATVEVDLADTRFLDSMGIAGLCGRMDTHANAERGCGASTSSRGCCGSFRSPAWPTIWIWPEAARVAGRVSRDGSLVFMIERARVAVVGGRGVESRPRGLHRGGGCDAQVPARNGALMPPAWW